MVANGYDAAFAERTFKQLEGFGSLRLSREPRRLLRADRLCLVLDEVPPSGRVLRALLNAQPMGFYAPAQIVRDARDHGVEVRPVGRQPLALGLHARAGRRATGLRCGSALRCAKGLANADAARIVAARGERPLQRRSRISGAGPASPARALVRLAEADAFGIAGLEPPRGALGDQGLARRAAAAVRGRATRARASCGPKSTSRPLSSTR